MTEDEAKKKWCPMVRALQVQGGGLGTTAFAAVNERGRCIASACMMWRWRLPQLKYKPTGEIYHGPLIIAKEAKKDWEELPRQGYCGLAGRIESAQPTTLLPDVPT